LTTPAEQLVPWDDPILTSPATEWDFDVHGSGEAIAHELVETMRELNGHGLSAPQIGYDRKVFVMRTDPVFAVFNPRVVDASSETEELEEACLSFPGLVCKVARPKMIRVRFQTPNGATTTQKFAGLTARIFLHEADHLLGKTHFHGKGRPALSIMVRRASKLGHNYDVGKLVRIAR
jgi:peptide deformylase